MIIPGLRKIEVVRNISRTLSPRVLRLADDTPDHGVGQTTSVAGEGLSSDGRPATASSASGCEGGDGRD